MTRIELQVLVWTYPMGQAAEKCGCTPEWLGHLCYLTGIRLPDFGHWRRLPARRQPMPALPPVPPGESEEVHVGKGDIGVLRRLQPATATIPKKGRSKAETSPPGTAKLEPLLLTQSEVAVQLRVSVKTVQRMREAGQIKFIPGRPVRIPKADVDAWLERTAELDLKKTMAQLHKAGRERAHGLSPAQRARREFLKRYLYERARQRRKAAS